MPRQHHAQLARALHDRGPHLFRGPQHEATSGIMQREHRIGRGLEPRRRRPQPAARLLEQVRHGIGRCRRVVGVAARQVEPPGVRRQRAAQVRRQRGAGRAARALLRRAVAQLARMQGVLQQLRGRARLASQCYYCEDQARLHSGEVHEPPATRLLRGVVHDSAAAN